MSWQAWTLAILGLALAGGFAWYERSRPPSQVVALVAALAAVAIAGRLAFAAIPNLVAITDIVLFAGYALGPAAGFGVGAIAGLVSNFWLGQGPWTPWQMAGWGGIGMAGALLPALGLRRPGRLSLAVACGLAGVGFGLLMNFSTLATFGGELSVERFGALQSRAIPFDAMHVAGNVALALIAGPAIIRMLERFKRRFQWTRQEPAGSPDGGPGGGAGPEAGSAASGVAAGGRAVALLAAMLACLAALALPGESRAAGVDVDAAASWLGSVQNPDGGFGPSPGDESSTVTTGWTILGLAAAGVNAHDVSSQGGSTPIDFLRRNVEEVSSTGDLARTIMALSSSGVDPRRFAGRNLVTELRQRRKADGSYESWPATTAFALIALRQAGAEGGMRVTLGWLRRVQNGNGGWGPTVGARSDPDTTGAVLQAIGGPDVVRAGLGYLRSAQRPSGGFATGGTGSVNTQSTAWAMQGVMAAGLRPSWLVAEQRSAPELLAAHQMPDGHVRYSARSDQTPTWVTANALVAAAGKTYPVPAPPREPRPQPAPEPEPIPGSSIPPPQPPAVHGGSGPGGGSGEPRQPFGGSDPSGRDGAGSRRGGGGGQSATVRPRPVDPASMQESGGGDRRGPSPGQPEPDSDRDTVTGSGSESAAGEAEPGPVASTRPGPSPVAPTGIGLGLAGLTAGGMWWLGRRRDW